MASMLPIMEETLRADGEVRMEVTGSSMMPLLRHRKDTVILKKIEGRLQRYDLPLYKRDDGAFVLHRILHVHAHGYTMCGDNQVKPEHHVKDDQLIAVATGFIRDGIFISCTDERYLSYVHKRCRTRVFRYWKAMVKRFRIQGVPHEK